jgi:sugar/nucleoside kinase (ribokinase family)
MTCDIVALGESLIDLVATEPVSYLHATAFKKCFGGAPMNTIVGVSRLGENSGAITAVGDDPLGQFVVEELKRNKVDVSQVRIKRGKKTALAFVANEPGTGERSFIFYRQPWIQGAADSELTPEDIDFNYISSAKILHISGFALSHNPSRQAVLHAINIARESGVDISFDPTLRHDIWESEQILKNLYDQVLHLSDIVTFSREESEFVFKTKNIDEAAELAFTYGVRVVGLKLGSKGALLATNEGETVYLPAFKVNAIDTTGAGDGWNAGLLVGLLNEWDLTTCCKVANAVGALVVTKRGAITALPYKRELTTFMRDHGLPPIAS